MYKYLFRSFIGLVASTLLLSTQAIAQVPIGIIAGYPKPNNTFDVVVKDDPGTKLTLYLDDKFASKTKVNKQDWGTFKKVKFPDSGKASFSQSVKKGLFSSREIPVNYVEYFQVVNGKLTFYSKDPTKTVPIGTRTKTSGCSISTNMEQDKSCTPGAIFLNTTKEMICKSGYSSSVRDVSNNTKNQVYTEYGITTHTSGQYEIDHLISLELGGSNDIANLWPEAATLVPGFHEKDKVENKLHSEVCSGTITLAAAQQEIANNWLNVYLSLFPKVSTAKTSVAAPKTVSTNTASTTTTTKTTTPVSTGVIKMSSTKICHAPGTTYYDRTLNFTPYNSLQECLNAGGRLPLR